jgi:ABC-type branched-subunit amino acid transport system substrate-binding protein
MRRRFLLVTSAALLLLAVAGASTAFGSKSNSKKALAPIKVGQIVAVGGAINFPDIVSGVKGAILSINKHGGIRGHKVVLEECNEGNSETIGVACARKLVADGIVADISSQSVYAEDEIGAIFQKAGIPQIGDNDLANWANQPNAFLLFYDSTNLTEAAFARLCRDAGDTKLDIPYLNFGPAGQILPDIEAGAKKEGVKVVATQPVPDTQTDFTTVVSQGLAAGANCFGGVILDYQYEGILNALHSLGSKAKVVISAGNFDPQDFKTAGALADQILVAAQYPVPTDTAQFPVFKQFQADMKAELAAGDKNAPYNESTARDNAINGWFAAEAFAKVEDASKLPLTRAGILKALKAVKNLNLGLPVLWNPNTAGPAGSKRVWNGQMFAQGFKNGQLYDFSTKPFNAYPFLAG